MNNGWITAVGGQCVRHIIRSNVTVHWRAVSYTFCALLGDFLMPPSGGRTGLQLFTLATQTLNQNRLTQTIFPPVLTIYNTTIPGSYLIAYVTVTSRSSATSRPVTTRCWLPREHTSLTNYDCISEICIKFSFGMILKLTNAGHVSRKRLIDSNLVEQVKWCCMRQCL